GAGGRLEGPEERIVAGLRVEVIRDDEEVTVVVLDLAGERLAARGPRRVRWIDAARAERKARRAVGARHDRRRGRRGPAGPIDEAQTVAVLEEEDLPDVAAGLTAVLVVDRIDRPGRVRRTPGRLDRVNEARDRQVRGDHAIVRGTGVVLDLLHGDDPGRAQVVHDESGQRAELRVRIARGEVLNVERRDGEVGEARGAGGLGRGPGRDEGRERGQLGHEVPEAVVDDADERAGETVPDADAGREGAEPRGLQDLVVDDDPLGIGIGVAPVADPATRRARPGAGAAVGQDGDFVERVRRTDDDGVVDADEHPLERLVEVDAVVRRIERAARLDASGRVVL